MFAAFIDNVAALLVMFVGAAAIRELAHSPLGVIPAPVLGFSVLAGYLLYFLVAEAVFSTTAGKFLFSLHVRRLDGTPCT